MPAIRPEELIDRYDALLLDAYGVLVDKTGPLPGAVEFIGRLNQRGKPYFLLTNSASRLPDMMAEELARMDLAIPASNIITSGMLLANWVRSNGLAGQSAVVLGTEDSLRYARSAGLRPLAPGALEERLTQQGELPGILVLADQAGFDLLNGINAVLSLLLQRLDRGRTMHLVLCNPDLIYPRAAGLLGVTAGGLAAMLEAILNERYGDAAPRFERLGKPNPPMFEEAVRRAGSRRLVMVGDQPATDIAGANRCGIDSALVDSGLAPTPGSAAGPQPTWRLSSLVGNRED
jgi:HAD superfamily hydrolase (TIGR01450 family)